MNGKIQNITTTHPSTLIKVNLKNSHDDLNEHFLYLYPLMKKTTAAATRSAAATLRLVNTLSNWRQGRAKP